MEESRLLNNIIDTEERLGLNEETVLGFPLWRIVRYHTRLHYITVKTGYETGAPTTKVGKSKPKLISGFWKVKKRQEISVFFPFNRLVFDNDLYLDKFVDPVIAESDIENQGFVIVDPQNYVCGRKRVHYDHVISNESRTVFQQVLKYWFRVVTPWRFGKSIKRLFAKTKDAFLLPDSYIKMYYKELSSFLARYYYYRFWFKRIRPKRVFLVYREGYFPQIVACKKLGIPVAEFQHGITLDKTVSFAGNYDQRIDPDYFLVFGEFWKGPQFGMPLDRIICIGWAYSQYLKKHATSVEKKDETDVLVISSPEISDAILEALSVLSSFGGECHFHIRLHPCESYTAPQKEKLARIPNASVVDNKQDSAKVLPLYKYVLGENSSVIYEALSMGCKVGMLDLCGLRPPVDVPGISDSFYIIRNGQDFASFIENGDSNHEVKNGFYSDFDKEKFLKFVNNRM